MGVERDALGHKYLGHSNSPPIMKCSLTDGEDISIT